MSFWQEHGIFFLLGLLCFPRLTVWLVSAVTGGFWFWIMFLFFPRTIIAILAAVTYWDTNPILVFISVIACVELEWTVGAATLKHFAD